MSSEFNFGDVALAAAAAMIDKIGSRILSNT
jgi:hypothetical protein